MWTVPGVPDLLECGDPARVAGNFIRGHFGISRYLEYDGTAIGIFKG